MCKIVLDSFGSRAWHVCVRWWGPDHSMRGICAACRHVLRHVGVTWYECHAAGSRCTVGGFICSRCASLDLVGKSCIPWHTDIRKSAGKFCVVRDRFVISYLVSRFSSCSHLLVSFLEGRIVKFKKLVYQFTALFASEFPVDSAFHFREFVKYRHSTCYSWLHSEFNTILYTLSANIVTAKTRRIMENSSYF